MKLTLFKNYNDRQGSCYKVNIVNFKDIWTFDRWTIERNCLKIKLTTGKLPLGKLPFFKNINFTLLKVC